MKTKNVLFALLLITASGFTFGQNHYEALNLQAHTNRKATTVAEAIALRDNGTLPAATLANPCATLAAVQAQAIVAGSAYRTGTVFSADAVNKEGATFYHVNSAPITIDWNNFDSVKATLDAHMIEIPINFGASRKAQISGSVWNNGVFQGFGWDATTIQGVHNCHAWDFRKETNNPLAVFPFGLVDCNNILDKDLLLSVFKGTATIGGGTSNNPSPTPPANNVQGTPNVPDQAYADYLKALAGLGGGGIIIAPYIAGNGSNNGNNNGTGGCPSCPNQTPVVSFVQPVQQQQQQTLLNPGMVTYTTPQQTQYVQPQVVQQQPVQYVQQPCNNCVDPYSRKIYQATTAAAVGSWIGPILGGATSGLMNRYLGVRVVNNSGYQQQPYPPLQNQVPNFTPRVPGTNGYAFNGNGVPGFNSGFIPPSTGW